MAFLLESCSMCPSQPWLESHAPWRRLRPNHHCPAYGMTRVWWPHGLVAILARVYAIHALVARITIGMHCPSLPHRLHQVPDGALHAVGCFHCLVGGQRFNMLIAGCASTILTVWRLRAVDSGVLEVLGEGLQVDTLFCPLQPWTGSSTRGLRCCSTRCLVAILTLAPSIAV